MLFLFLKYLYLAIVALIYGVGTKKLLQKIWKVESKTLLFPSLTILMGLASITCLVSYLTFLIPISGLANLLILLLALSQVIFLKEEIFEELEYLKNGIKQTSLPQKIIFIYGLLYILFLSVQQTLSMDEGVYHAQFILWAENYPIVKGLSNILPKLGFNTHWHLTSTLFNWSFLTGQESNQINGVLYLLMLAFCLKGWSKEWKVSNLLRLLLLVFIHYSPLHVFHIIAPSADTFVIFVEWMVFILLIEKIEENTFDVIDQRVVFILLMCCFLLTVKLSSLPIVLVSLPFVWTFLKKRQWNQVGLLIILGLFFILPWLGRNVYLTGYLVYPFESLDVLNVDWKVSLEQVKKEAKWIHDAGFLLAKESHNNAVMQLPFWAKLKIWFSENLHLNDQLMIAFLMICPLLQVFSYLSKRTIFYRKSSYLFLCLSLWLGILFWLIQSPNPRFGYGFTIFTCLVSLAPFLMFLKIRKEFWVTLCLVGVVGFQVVTYFYYQKKMSWFLTKEWVVKSKPKHSILWMPKPYPKTKSSNQNGLNYVQGWCWDTDLPCVNKMNEDVERRGEGVGEGFRQIK